MAVNWYRKAAHAGDKGGMYRLAVAYGSNWGGLTESTWKEDLESAGRQRSQPGEKPEFKFGAESYFRRAERFWHRKAEELAGSVGPFGRAEGDGC
jgi:TPR repeat protein